MYIINFIIFIISSYPNLFQPSLQLQLPPPHSHSHPHTRLKLIPLISNLFINLIQTVWTSSSTLPTISSHHPSNSPFSFNYPSFWDRQFVLLLEIGLWRVSEVDFLSQTKPTPLTVFIIPRKSLSLWSATSTTFLFHPTLSGFLTSFPPPFTSRLGVWLGYMYSFSMIILLGWNSSRSSYTLSSNISHNKKPRYRYLQVIDLHLHPLNACQSLLYHPHQNQTQSNLSPWFRLLVRVENVASRYATLQNLKIYGLEPSRHVAWPSAPRRHLLLAFRHLPFLIHPTFNLSLC